MGQLPTEVNTPQQPLRSKGVSKYTFFFTVALVATIGFVVGTRSTELYAAVAPLFGVKTTADTLDLSSVQNTYRQLKVNYDGELDAAALIDGASRGLTAAAGDQYTVFMDAKEAAEFAKDLNGEVSGIGAEIGVRDDRPTIIRVLEDSPAKKSGLQANDVFLAVNDKSVAADDASAVASQVRGEEGTTVKLLIQRGEETKEFTIVRAKVTDASVRTSLQDGIGTIKVSRFDTETGELVEDAAREFKNQGVKGVILDLRDNGGGYLDQAQRVAGVWLDGKVVVTEKAGGKITDELRSANHPILQGVSTIVLVNGGSASASEIVAGALQDHGVATLIGEKTYGKGSVQKLITLPGGRELKVTIAKWYTPKGKNISKEGISPDKKVELTSEDMNAGRDPQAEAARQAILK